LTDTQPVLLKDFIKFVKSGPNWNEFKGLKKYLDAVQEREDAKDELELITKKNEGGYVFHPPLPPRCGGNLYEKRIFKHEVKGRTGNQIRVMHWNILADGLSGSGLSLINGYSKSLEKQFASPKECLVWDYRKWLILEEIAHYDPDIITLVELDINNARMEGNKKEDTFEY